LYWRCRRRRANKISKYARCRYAQSQDFDDPVESTITKDMAFINRFEDFIFYEDELPDQLDSGVIGVQRRHSLLSAHEDALRVATSSPSRRSSSQAPDDRDQRSNNNNNKVRVDA